MTITFLDSSTLNPGDLDFSSLAEFGTLTLHEVSTPGEVADRLRNTKVAITNKAPIDAATISSCPDLKLILVAATGVNVVDLDAAAAHDIPVCNVAGYSTSSVAQHVVALLLNLATNVHRYVAEADRWPQSPIFTRLDHPATELAGKTCGIVGLGEIGSAVARIVEALGMTVQVLGREGSRNASRPDLLRVPHGEFFATSDVVSLHCPLTEENHHFINADTLARMKPGSFLLNASRGPLVDEQALAAALRTGPLAGAGLDVLSTEPPPPDHPLLTHEALGSTLLITPHSAWIPRESRQRLLDGLIGNLQAFLDGTPTNRVA